MDRSQGTLGQKIARAVRAFENRRTKCGRAWVTVFLNENPIVIALHGSLTAEERTRARSPAGAEQVRAFHRRLFTKGSDPLLRKIKSLTGMDVLDTTAEIEPATDSVVHVFTTDTAPERFLLAAE